jgi:hypothetical protein
MSPPRTCLLFATARTELAMGVEYNAPVRPTKACIASILRELETDGRYRVLPSSRPGRILLRLAARPPRDEWPEDIEVRFHEGVYVAFHSADRDERNTFLRFLESKLTEFGCDTKFSEE